MPADQRHVRKLVPPVRQVRSEFPLNGVNEVRLIRISKCQLDFSIMLLKQMRM